MILIS